MLYTAEESRYITWPWDAHTRNQHICDALRLVRKPVIWDAYAGVGGDAVQLLSVVARSVVHAIQTKAVPGRINRLQQNVAPFAGRCIVHKCSSTAFIMRQKSQCDLLYLDPPWMEGSRDLSAAEMVGRLMVEVFDVLVAPVGIVCLKTRFSWQELNLENAELDRTLETAYFFHFFRLSPDTCQ
jgi:16S rRNA G966 N2-methylase RsmD